MSTVRYQVRKLEELREKERAVGREIEAHVLAMFPIGARISWIHNSRYRQTGTVVAIHAFGSSTELRARNDRTGKDVRVELYFDPRPL